MKKDLIKANREVIDRIRDSKPYSYPIATFLRSNGWQKGYLIYTTTGKIAFTLTMMNIICSRALRFEKILPHQKLLYNIHYMPNTGYTRIEKRDVDVYKLTTLENEEDDNLEFVTGDILYEDAVYSVKDMETILRNLNILDTQP